MANLVPAMAKASRYQQEKTSQGWGKLKGMMDRKRMNDLGGKFVQMGEYTPQRLQQFAKENNASHEDMYNLIEVAKSFNKFADEQDPWETVDSVDETGKSIRKKVRQSQIAGQEVTTGLAPQRTDIVNGKPVLSNSRSAYSDGAVTPDMWSSNQADARYQRGLDSNENIAAGRLESDKAKRTLNQKKQQRDNDKQILENIPKTLIPGFSTSMDDLMGDETEAKSIYDQVSAFQNDADPRKSFAAKSWIGAYNRQVGMKPAGTLSSFENNPVFEEITPGNSSPQPNPVHQPEKQPVRESQAPVPVQNAPENIPAGPAPQRGSYLQPGPLVNTESFGGALKTLNDIAQNSAIPAAQTFNDMAFKDPWNAYKGLLQQLSESQRKSRERLGGYNR